MYLPELFEFPETTMQIILSLIKTSQRRMIQRCISSGGSKSQKQAKAHNYHPLQCAGLNHYAHMRPEAIVQTCMHVINSTEVKSQ